MNKFIIEEQTLHENLTVEWMRAIPRVDKWLKQWVVRLNVNASSRKRMHGGDSEKTNVVVEDFVCANIRTT